MNNDNFEQLKILKDLYDSNIISAEEFEHKKRMLLGLDEAGNALPVTPVTPVTPVNPVNNTPAYTRNDLPRIPEYDPYRPQGNVPQRPAVQKRPKPAKKSNVPLIVGAVAVAAVVIMIGAYMLLTSPERMIKGDWTCTGITDYGEYLTMDELDYGEGSSMNVYVYDDSSLSIAIEYGDYGSDSESGTWRFDEKFKDDYGTTLYRYTFFVDDDVNTVVIDPKTKEMKICYDDYYDPDNCLVFAKN